MADKTRLELQGDERKKKEVCYVEADNSTYFFDFTFTMDHSINVVTTSHPVQKGADITDHAYRQPDEVTVEVGYSDTVISGGDNHSLNAFKTLDELATNRTLLKLVTRRKVYNNMIISSISVPDNFETMNSLKATIIFKEIIIATVLTVSAAGSGTSGSKSGTETTGDGTTGTVFGSFGKKKTVTVKWKENKKTKKKKVKASTAQEACDLAGIGTSGSKFTGNITITVSKKKTYYYLKKGKINEKKSKKLQKQKSGNSKTPTQNTGTKTTK